MRKFAQGISAITNPLMVAIPFSYLLVLRTNNNSMYAFAWTIISMAFAGLVGLFVFYGVKIKIFSDYDVSIRSERPILFAFTGCISILYFVAVYLLKGPTVLLVGLATLLVSILVAEIINTHVKASMHMAVYSAFALSVGLLYGNLYWLLVLGIPIVAWSRIRLKRHTPKEAKVGTMLGLSIVFILYIVVKLYL